MMRQPKTAVLLAAGRGKRLRPHTDHTPKPLLPVNGRPTLDYVLEAIGRAGIEHVCLVTHYLEEQIIDYVGDGFAWGMNSCFVHQPEMRGTGDALLIAMQKYPDLFTNSFLMTATDYIFERDHVTQLVEFHRNHQADMSISLKDMGLEALSGRSSVRYTADFDIQEIVEKPKAGQAPSPYATSLLYVLSPDIQGRLAILPPSPRGEVEVQGAFNQLLVNGMTAKGLVQPVPAEWSSEIALDIGRKAE